MAKGDKLWVCSRCGYHYPDERMVRETRDRVLPDGSVEHSSYRYCADRYSCDQRIAQRELDRQAVKGTPQKQKVKTYREKRPR